MVLIQTVLVGHHLAAEDEGKDGGTFITVGDTNVARDFGTVDAARDFIKTSGINMYEGRDLNVWHVFILTEIPFD